MGVGHGGWVQVGMGWVHKGGAGGCMGCQSQLTICGTVLYWNPNPNQP